MFTNEANARFKINISARGASLYPVAPLVKRKTIFGVSWEEIARFDTKAEATELYNKIKDLPEYLA